MNKENKNQNGIKIPEITRIDYIRDLIKNCKFDDALEQLEIMEVEEPDNFEVFYELGRIYFELGNYESSISNYEKLLEYQQNAIFYYNLGQSYELNDEIDKAMSNYLKCVTVNEKFALAYKKLGILFMARGDIESAKEYFNDYLKLDIPKSEKDTITKILERIEKNESNNLHS